jgi:hypothetical protein
MAVILRSCFELSGVLEDSGTRRQELESLKLKLPEILYNSFYNVLAR